MHNALSDTQSSLDSACRFAAEPSEGVEAVALPVDPNSSFGLFFWDQELSRAGIVSTCPAQPHIN